MRKISTLLLSLLLLSIGWLSLHAQKNTTLLFDFETESSGWQAGTPPNFGDSSAKAVKLSTKNASQGKQAIELIFEKNDMPKAVFFVEAPTDLSTESHLLFDLYGSDATSGVALALSTGSSWEWHESGVVPVKPGKQTLAFDLTASTYKSQASQWELTTAIKNLASTQRIALVVFPDKTGSIFIDNIRLTSAVASDVSTASQTTTKPTPTATPKPKVAKPLSAKTLALQPATQPIARYGRLEMQIKTDLVVDNPFDPAQADLWVSFTSPSGKVSRVPAFWYQDYSATVLPLGKPDWRVRFTPVETGTWQAQAAIGTLQSKPISFTVQTSDSPGFIRINPENSHYFAFDTGDLYVPIGLNIGWASGQGATVLRDYARWFDRLSANGGNVARIWMADWSFGIEWNDTPLGDYGGRMDRAWLLDQVFQMAEERGIYIMLTLLHHGPFSTSVNPQWEQNPYNVKNGGMLKSPAEFVTNPAAKELFKQRLRYIAARWGYSPNLFAWEWWNEINWTPIGDKQLIPWSAEMAEVLAEYDPNDHLLTSSYANGRGHQLWASPEIDFTQQHDYSGNDPLKEFDYSLQSIRPLAPDKPILMGEQGLSAGGADAQSLENEIIHFHNGIWTAPFLGYAGSGMYWWWDTFVDPKAQWIHYKTLADFIQGEDLTKLLPAAASAKGLKARILRSESSALLWIRSNNYNAAGVSELYNADILKALKEKRTVTDWKYDPPLISAAKITLTGLTDGNYVAHWYDSQTATWLANDDIEVKGGEVVLTVPDFNKDIAVKIVTR